MEKVKFGCHNFLNSKPILVPLLAKRFSWLEVVQHSPAKLAQMLKCRTLDIAFIPSVEYADDPEYRLVKGVSISSHKKVKTVLLICKKTMNEVKTIAADSRSRSSIALLQLLLMKRYNRLPLFRPMKPDFTKMLDENDGALIIGDESFRVKPTNGLKVYDLSSEWYQLTEKPFVHAVLCTHVNQDQNRKISQLIDEILVSLDRSKNSFDHIAINAAKDLGIKSSTCIEYLTNIIKYTFDEPEFDSLKTFFILAKQYNVIENVPDLHFLGNKAGDGK
ncbi:MAG: menaquinone biosynthesis protein [Desulfobacteraceae bacterium]|jgi:chorismate dehydratase